jgi:ABC-type phosphate transport system ATPase subunit
LPLYSLSVFENPGIFGAMSTVQEIEAAIPRLTRSEVEELRVWIEDYLEDQLELTDDVKSKLDQSRREIAGGQYTIRQPEPPANISVMSEIIFEVREADEE